MPKDIRAHEGSWVLTNQDERRRDHDLRTRLRRNRAVRSIAWFGVTVEVQDHRGRPAVENHDRDKGLRIQRQRTRQARIPDDDNG